jgi:hypothetical protein
MFSFKIGVLAGRGFSGPFLLEAKWHAKEANLFFSHHLACWANLSLLQFG